MFNFNQDDNSYEFGLFLQDKLYQVLGKISKVGNKLNFPCPLCNEGKSRSKRRGWYYLDSNTYFCFNAGCIASETGLSGIQFVSKLLNISQNSLKLDFLKNKNKKSEVKQIEEEPIIQKEEAKPIESLPKDWYELSKTLNDYIEKRKIYSAPYCPKNWNFYFNIKTNRLVIPWYRDKQIIFYQERAILPGQEPKYKFPYNVEKPIFGLDSIDEIFPYIFILEGAFDSIWVKNGISIGGITLTENQEKDLEHYFCEKIYLFDNQNVDESAYKKIMKMSIEKPNQKIFIWPKNITEKDVNEYIINHSNNPFNNEKFLLENSISGLKIQLKLRMKL